MSIKKLLVTLPLLQIPLVGFAQNTVVYHSFVPMAGEGPLLLEWMVEPDTLTDTYIKETIDPQGRVIELRFMEGENIADFTCFDPALYRYTYRKNEIVEFRYDDAGRSIEGECGVPYKVVYKLDDSELITHCIKFTDYGAARNREEYILNEERYRNYEAGAEGKCSFILAWRYSSARYSGKNIVSSTYVPRTPSPWIYSEEAAKSEYAIHNASTTQNR